ncbi:hypothetical protein [Streptomyces sp. PA5.6]|uniref:hypothetical protein n=1 Tax=Streptomyces sp. PA5.6 TaxID=3035651 RepID=UPI00390493D1
MRRTATWLGAAAAAVLLSVSVPASARAADGVLVIDGQEHHNPSGCYDLRDSEVENRTDQPAVVYSGYACEGDVVETIQPGGQSFIDWGQSLRIQ